MITPRDKSIIRSVAYCDVLLRDQVSRLHFPGDDGRATRKRLKVLRDLGLLNQTHCQVVNPLVSNIAAPVYYSSAEGIAFLMQEDEDDSYLSVNTTTPHWLYLHHLVAVSETHMTLDGAVELRSDVQVLRWYGERSVLNARESDPAKKFRMYTLLRSEPNKLVCNPDAGFLLARDNGQKKIFYLEQDRDSTKSAERVSAQKTGGFAGLFEQRCHLKHFPDANVEKFSVLVVAPTTRRREALRAAFGTKPHCWLYKFASLTDMKPETFLSGPIWYPCVGEPVCLLKTGDSAGPLRGPA